MTDTPVDSPVDTAVLVTALTALAAPVVLLLAQRTMLSNWRPDRWETASILATTGWAATLILNRPAAVLVPLAALGVAAAIVDAREQRLPDLLTGPLLLATTTAALIEGTGWLTLTAPAVALTGGVLVHVLNADVLGWGDIKLLPSLALIAAPHGHVIVVVVTAAVLIAATAAGCRVLRWRGPVPYGPALIISTLTAATG